jgi:hypothetical protein
MLCIAPPYDSLAILALACTPNILLVVSLAYARQLCDSLAFLALACTPPSLAAAPLSWGSIFKKQSPPITHHQPHRGFSLVRFLLCCSLLFFSFFFFFNLISPSMVLYLSTFNFQFSVFNFQSLQLFFEDKFSICFYN